MRSAAGRSNASAAEPSPPRRSSRTRPAPAIASGAKPDRLMCSLVMHCYHSIVMAMYSMICAPSRRVAGNRRVTNGPDRATSSRPCAISSRFRRVCRRVRERRIRPTLPAARQQRAPPGRREAARRSNCALQWSPLGHASRHHRSGGGNQTAAGRDGPGFHSYRPPLGTCDAGLFGMGEFLHASASPAWAKGYG